MTLEPRLAEALRDLTIDTDSPAELADLLYARLHAGFDLPERTYPKRDRWLERAFELAVPHHTTPVTAVLREVRDRILVEWEGVLVWLPRDSAQELPSIGQPVQLRVPPVRPALSPGFQFVMGSHVADFTGPLLRVYVHLTDPDSAVAVWRTVLCVLEDKGIGYHAKVLSRAAEYPRRDGLVVYLPQDCADSAYVVADAACDMRGVGSETSVFAHRIGPGVASAWEPADKRFGMSGLSFGQHRAKVLARALLDSAASGEPVESVVLSAFRAARIDPANPAANLEQVE